jgi:hypothetical protein
MIFTPLEIVPARFWVARTVISNGVNLSGKHNLKCFHFSVRRFNPSDQQARCAVPKEERKRGMELLSFLVYDNRKFSGVIGKDETSKKDS